MESVAEPTIPAPEEEEDNNNELELEIRSLEEQAKEQLPADLVVALGKISYQISKNGLRIEEACLIANYNLDKFGNFLKTEPLVQRIIDMKELSYKRDLLATLSRRARSGDHKISQWLLETRFPEEFAKKGAGGGEPGEDFLGQALDFVQKNGDSNPIVSEKSGKAILIKPKAEQKDLNAEVEKFLS